MAKSADAADLKSAALKWVWGFKSPSGHHIINLHREKIGRKSDAIALYQQRKSSIRAGAKLPPNVRLASVRFQSLADEILLFSQNHHRDQRNIASRLKRILPDFGNRLADQIKPADIDGWMAANTSMPNQISDESLAGIMEAFLAVFDLHPAKRTPTDLRYIANLPIDEKIGKKKAIEIECGDVRHLTKKTIQALKNPAPSQRKPILAARNLLTVLDCTVFPSQELLNIYSLISACQ